jgi:hypothetical protein
VGHGKGRIHPPLWIKGIVRREKRENGKRTVRTCARAAISIVAELMDVHAALGVGVVAGDVPGDGGGGGFGALLEGDGAFDGRVSAEDGDCQGWIGQLRFTCYSNVCLGFRI